MTEQPNIIGGLHVYVGLKNIVSELKSENKKIYLHAQIKDDGAKMGDININMNNVTPEGVEYIKKQLQTDDLVLNTPLIMTIGIPFGATLDHWEEEMEKEVETEIDEEETEQTTLETEE